MIAYIHNVNCSHSAIAEKRKQAEDAEEGEVEGARVTALDLEDAWEAEAKLFTPAPRVTGRSVCTCPCSHK